MLWKVLYYNVYLVMVRTCSYAARKENETNVQIKQNTQ